MNYAKINMFLLIVAIAGIAAALYFLFVNQKHTNKQDDALAAILKSIYGEEIPSKGQEKVKEEKEELPAKPTKEEMQQIYVISEKIYFKKPLTIHDKNFQKKFDSYIQEDLEYCKEFYPLVDKLAFPEKYNVPELSAEENEFYEANKEQVDKQVAHVKEQALKASEKDNTEKVKEESADLTKANPPSTKDEKLKIILGFFEDGIPKSTPQLIEMYDKKTKSTTGKNLYRFLKNVEAEQLFFQKIDNLVYYGLSAWFEGKKLKPEFKKNIV